MEPAVMPSRRDHIGPRKPVLAIWLGASLLAFAPPVRAEVRVSGQADAVIVQARAASLEEVLAALGASFNLHYRTSDALNRAVTGTFSGSLKSVIAHLLKGHNYVLQASAGGGELIVLGSRAAGGSPAATGHRAMAVTQQQELPARNSAPAVPAKDATTQAEQPIAPPLPDASVAMPAFPRDVPKSLSFPAPSSNGSPIVPPQAVPVPGLAPPMPATNPQIRPPGWNG